jgi:predicted Zn-dependent protease
MLANMLLPGVTPASPIGASRAGSTPTGIGRAENERTLIVTSIWNSTALIIIYSFAEGLYRTRRGVYVRRARDFGVRIRTSFTERTWGPNLLRGDAHLS